MKKYLLMIFAVLLVTTLFSCLKETPKDESNNSITSNTESINSDISSDINNEVKYMDVALGNGNAFYLTEDGDLYCVGYNSCSTLGLGIDDEEVNIPTKLPIDKKIKLVSACFNMCAVLTTENEVFIFGVDPKHVFNMGLD